MRSKNQTQSEQTFNDLTVTMKETWKIVKEASRTAKEASRAAKENSQQMKDSERRMKALEKKYGGLSYSNGKMAEEYFYNAFKKDKSFVNEKFDHIRRNFICVDPVNEYEDIEAELDILLFNGRSAAIIEVKYRAEKDSISIKNLIERISIIKRVYPEYANHTFYLGVAAMSFGRGISTKLHRNGIATIRQVGKKMIIYDKEVKEF